MKRNLDLIRQIAMTVETATSELNSSTLEINGFSSDDVRYNCHLMDEAGLLWTDGGTQMHACFKDFLIFGLSWAGHDFIDAARNDTLWNRVKRQVKEKVTSLAFDALLAVLRSEGTRLATQAVEMASR